MTSPGARVSAERAQLPAAPPVTTASGSTKALKEPPPALRVTAKVLDLQGRPIEGAELLAGTPWSWKPTPIAHSDAQGRLFVELPFTTQELSFTVLATGFAGARREADALPGAELRLGEFRLGPGSEVAGRVVDEAGAGLADAWVQWLPAAEFPADPVAAREDGVGEDSWSEARLVGTASCADDGSFRLRGLPLGECFLLAGANGRQFGWTPLFDLRAGPSAEQLILLPSSPRAGARISGVVTDPSGAELGGIEVMCREPNVPGGHWTMATTDAAGRFAFEPWGSALDVGAQDPEKRWATVWSQAVQPGTRDLELRMQPPVWLVIRLVDTDGRAVPWGHVRLAGELHDGGREGIVRVHRPEVSFEVQVSAPGFRVETQGPLDAPPPGEELRLVLQPGQALKGRILHRGRPVAGARLDLAPARAPGEFVEVHGHAPMDQPFLAQGHVQLGAQDGTSDKAGAFLLTIHGRGWQGLRVEAEGFPLSVFGPFELDPELGREGLELELERAGSLAGFVRLAPGAEPRERLVAASSGWGFARTATLDEQGAYRIDDLAPGLYQVRICEPPAASLQPLGLTSARAAEIEWDCQVRSGETTRFDLDLTGEGSVVLSGRLERPGSGVWIGEAMLFGADTPTGDRARPRARSELGPEGRFELAVSRPGRYRLETRLGPLQLREELELFAGPNEWQHRIETGRLWLRASGGSAAPHLRYVARAADGLECVVEYRWWSKQARDEGLRFEVPIGPGRLETASAEDPDVWTLRRELTFEPGQELALDFP